MYPVLFKIGSLTVYTYGLMIFIAVIVTLNLLVKESMRLGYDKDTVFDLGITIIFSGIIGARLLYVLLNLRFYSRNPKEIFMLHHGGLAILGGIVAALIASCVFMKLKKLPFFSTLDLIAPFIALGQSIGRIGCLFNGCCYGLPSKFGFYFSAHDAILLPTQLISSFLLLILFIVLRVKLDRPHSTGIIFVSYILFYSVLRFLNLTFFQYFCLGLFLYGLILYYRVKWKR